jgi:hypothetical protein
VRAGTGAYSIESIRPLPQGPQRRSADNRLQPKSEACTKLRGLETGFGAIERHEMDRQKVLKGLRAQVSKLHREVYSNTGDAFAHVAVREYFTLDDEDALEYCDVGGSHDKGIDAFWIDHEERRAIVVQAKWADKQTSFRADVVREAEAAYRWLVRVGEGKGPAAAPRVVDAARELYRARRDDPDFPIQIYVVVAGSFTKGAREEQARVADGLKRDNVDISLVALDELLEGVDDRISLESRSKDVKPEVTFTLGKDGFFEHGDDPKALVATLSGSELAEAAHTWGHHLFMRNLRFLLPGKARGSVNMGIKQTLGTPDGRQHFWYFNNGIAIVCESYEIAPDHATVAIHNMQIVNGAQTTMSLQNALEQLRLEPTASVLARIIAAPDDELQQSITYYNNRQNAVKDRDLQSNDPNQDRLHAEFLQQDPPWFYERKRGEWNALTARDAQLKKRLTKRRIDNERVAQAAYAFYFDPGRARADKKDLFQRRSDGGYYEDIFSESRTAAWLLLPYLLAEYIRGEKNSYLKRIRGIDARKANVEQRRLLSREWLKFADQFVLGTMAFYIEMRGGLDDESLKTFLCGDFEGMANGMYYAAIRDLHVLFTRKGREATPSGEMIAGFSAANYVKANWDEAQLHLQAEWDAREAVGDPLAGVPMLRLDDVAADEE